MQIYSLACLLFSFTLLSAVFSATSVNATVTWRIKTVDENHIVSPGGVIAIDSNNYPHIVYNHAEESKEYLDIMYSSWNGSSWQTQNVTTANGVIDLKLDSNNIPNIIYDGSPNGYRGQLMYASWTGTNWSIQTVDPIGSRGASLALDSENNPHIAYKSELVSSGDVYNNAALKYASLAGSSWSIQTLASPISIGDGIYLAMDSHNNPHITYGHDNPGIDRNHEGPRTLKYTVFNGSSWDTQTAFTGLSQYGNLILDSSDYPHFTIVKNSPQGPSYWHNMNLTYAGWNGSSWNTQTVDSNIDGRGYLALNSHDIPNIDYMREGSLMYARWTDMQWNIQTVGPNSSAYNNGPLVLDSQGNPHIVYAGVPTGGPLNYVGTCMYATQTIETTPTNIPIAVSPPTLTSTLIFELLWITVLIAIFGAIVAIVYIWKRRN